jgi:hypothetical protein
METTEKKKVIDLPYFIKKISNGNNKEKKILSDFKVDMWFVNTFVVFLGENK